MPAASSAPSDPHSAAVAAFIARWSHVGAAERANYALFLTELCPVLAVPPPDPASDDTANNAYVFERFVAIHRRGAAKPTHGRIDLYKRACFVLEAKQYAATKSADATLDLQLGDPDATARSSKIARGTAAWDRAMLEALGQAEEYARSLPTDEDPPPFLLVVDVGHVIELYADFTQKGKNYLPPSPISSRIRFVPRNGRLRRPRRRGSQGIVRWLRPDYQKPLFAGDRQSALALDDTPAAKPAKKSAASPKSKIANRKSKIPWPKTLSDRVRAVETALAAEEKPATAAELTTRFARADAAVIAEILQTLVTLGRARPGDTKGTFVR